MRTLHKLILPTICAALLSACATKYDATTPEVQQKMLSDLQNGNLVLDCTLSCMFTWTQQAGAVHALDEAERWNDLYVQVMKIGYRQDIAYYYLGQAAQGLGYHQAAIKYYKYAQALATGQSAIDQCAAKATEISNPCQGVDIAAVAPVLIKASEDVLASQAKPAATQNAAANSSQTTKKVKKAPPSSGSTWVTPPPPASGSTWTVPPPAN